MPDPNASYDALEILAMMGQRAEPLAEAEIHLFCYLSCLLSLYRGRPASMWGYGFASTGSGSPYSSVLSSTIADLARANYVDSSNGVLVLSSNGQSLLVKIGSLQQARTRRPFLEAASSSILAMSFGQFRYSMMQEPSLRWARQSNAPHLLAVGPALDILHEQFRVLSAAIGPSVDDLLIPAVVWLTFLANTRQHADIARGHLA